MNRGFHKWIFSGMLSAPLILNAVPSRSMGRMPGDCPKQWITPPPMNVLADSLKLLSAQIQLDDDLHLMEAGNLLPFLKSSESADEIDPIMLARRAQALKTLLSHKEWHHLIKLWARYIGAQSEAFRIQWDESLCSPPEYKESLQMDAQMLIAVPRLVVNPKLWNASQAGASSLMLVWGTAGLAGDVVTFIPSYLMRSEGHWRKDGRIKTAAKAFRKFAEAVQQAEQKKKMAGHLRE